MTDSDPSRLILIANLHFDQIPTSYPSKVRFRLNADIALTIQQTVVEATDGTWCSSHNQEERKLLSVSLQQAKLQQAF